MINNSLKERAWLPTLTLVIFAATILILLYGFYHLDWLKSFFSKSSYYFIFALTVIWASVLVKACKVCQFNILQFCSRHKNALLLVIIFSSVIFLSVPKYFRVLSDETNLLSVARSMTFEKSVDNVTEGFFYNNKLVPIQTIIEIRPFLFPFFIHLLHTFLGYRPENVFVLNYFSLAGLLFTIYLLLRAYLPEIWSLCAVIFILSQPIISLVATSGSYEIFNCFFIALSFLSLRWFITTRLPIAFEVLFFNLLLLANIRHESFIFFVIIMLFLVLDRYINQRIIAKSWMIVFSPLLCLGWLGQKLINIVQHGALVDVNYHWFDHLHVKFIPKNAYYFFNYIFDWSGSLGYAGVLNLLGSIAFCFCLFFLFFKNQQSDNERYLFLLYIAVILIHFIVVCAFAGGSTSHPMNGRYYLPLIILFSISPSIMGYSCLQGSFVPFYAVLAAVTFFITYHPKAMQDTLIPHLNKTKENIYIRKFLDKNAQPNALMVCAFPWQYTIYNRGAISFATANKDKNRLLRELRRHLFSKIYVFQEISYKPSNLFNGYRLDQAYHLETLEEIEIQKRSYFLRISEVK